jgi:tetratricopeptide (TPR) repeat protein
MRTGQEEEAKRIADKIYANVSKQWADSVKESFPGSDARFEAFINAAKACSAVGERDAARRSVNEALTGREIDRLDMDSFSTLARLSVKTGQEDDILTSVRKSENENFRGFAVGEIAEALASAGRFNEALDAALDVKHPYVPVYRLVRIMRALDKNGMAQDARQALDSALTVSLREEERTASDLSDKVSLKADAAQALMGLGRKEEAELLVREALQIAPGIDKEKKWKQRSAAYTDIVSALLKLDNIEEALIAYREITAQPIQMIAASKLALKLVKTGRMQEALSVASNVRGTDVAYSNPVFAAIAIERGREGRPEEALDVMRNIDGAGEKVAMADMFRGNAFTGIAKALAGMGRYREALELADQPTVNDKLEIYSSILKEYAKERNPALAMSLKVEEQDEAIFPWLRD